MKKLILFLICFIGIHFGLIAQANVAVKILSPTSFAFHFSGTVVGPVPNGDIRIIFVDVPVDSTIWCSNFSFSGSAMVGAQNVSEIHVGYDNAPYHGSIQFRTPANMTAGDTLSGCDTVSFSVAHGLTQNMFNGNYPIYWGRGPSATWGTFQSYADSNSANITVPQGSNQTFCGGSGSTLQDISVVVDSGSTYTWYNSASGGSMLPGSTVLQDSMTYYVEVDGASCLTTRVPVSISLINVPEPSITVGDTFSYCNGDVFTLQDLVVNGDTSATFTWYDAASGGNMLNTSDTLQNGQTYYVSQSLAGCESGRDSVLVEIITVDTAVIQSGNTLTADVFGLQYQWMDCDSNAIIIGATGQSFTPATNGNYAVILTNGMCTDTSSCYVIDGIIGIENGLDQLITIWPNPVKEQLMIRTEEDMELSLFAADGRLLKSYSVGFGEKVISMDGLSSGIYFLEARKGDLRKGFQIIKE